MPIKTVLLIIGALILTAGAVFVIISTMTARRPLSASRAEEAIRARLNAIVTGSGSVRNAVVAVDAPDLGVSVRYAAGDAAPGRPMTPDTMFHSASVGKLHTAVTVFSLARDGLLDIDRPIGEIADLSRFSGMLVVDGTDRLGDLTPRQLLAHRSGLPDHFGDASNDGSRGTLELLLSEPDRVWTIESRLEYVRDHFKPAGIPGGDYHYADTNYDLLGYLVQEVTGRPFEEVRRERALAPAGMVCSGPWPPAGEPDTSEAAIAQVWIDSVEVSRRPAVSVDGPGGGLAVTADDLVAFMRALNAGRTLPALTELQPPAGEWGRFFRGIDYGYGLMAIRPGMLSPFMKNYPVLFGHSGITGSFVYWIPEYNAVIAGTFNNSDWGQSRHVVFILQVLSMLRRVELNGGLKSAG